MTTPQCAKRLTFVVDSLACGGVARAVVSLAHGLLQRGYRVSVISFTPADRDFFSLPEGVHRYVLEPVRGRSGPWLKLLSTAHATMRRLKIAIDATHPDVVIAHAPRPNVMTLLAMLRSPYPVIVTEHGDVATRPSSGKPWLWRKWVWYRLRRYCYARAEKVVSVSAAIDRNVAWLPKERRAIIHNPFSAVDSSSIPAPLPAGASPERPWLISLGRLSHAKGYDILIEAFATIARQFPQWQLVVVGDGALRESLERQAAPLGDQIVFAGAIPNPFTLLRQAQLFVMASRYEGFPMAHGEALMCGLPVIATDCPSGTRQSFGSDRDSGGVRELIRDGIDGILVAPQDAAALAKAMATCMADAALRERLARAAPLGVARFSHESILDTWQGLFNEVCALKGGSERKGLALRSRRTNPALSIQEED